MTYLLNPDNAAFLAGDRPHIARAPASCLNPIIAAVLLIFAAASLTVSFQITSKPLQLTFNGDVVEGIVIDMNPLIQNLYRVLATYTYEVNGLDYQGQDWIAQRTYSGEIPRIVEVYYARHNPQLSQLDAPIPSSYLFLCLGSALLFACFSVGIVARYSSPFYRWRALNREGELIKGEVLAVTVEETERGVRWRLRYRLYPDDKRPVYGLYIYTPTHPYARHPQIGDTLAILYVNDKLHQPL